jgi:hypothetical protein
MITFFKIFESGLKFEFLTTDEEVKLREYVTPIIYEYLDRKIPKLKIYDFDRSNYNYSEVLNSYILDIFFFRNMYKYSRDNISESKTPIVYNTFQRILEAIIVDSGYTDSDINIYVRLENRLVELFEESPEVYKDCYDIYEDDFSDTLKSKLQYIFASEKFNL